MFHRFYTLDKKPTVWNILFLTVLMLLGMAVILSRHTVSTPWFLAVYIVFHLAVLGMLIRAFFRHTTPSTTPDFPFWCSSISSRCSS